MLYHSHRMRAMNEREGVYVPNPRNQTGGADHPPDPRHAGRPLSPPALCLFLPAVLPGDFGKPPGGGGRRPAVWPQRHVLPLPPLPGPVSASPGVRGLRPGEHRPADALGGGRLPGVQLHQSGPQGPEGCGVSPGAGPVPERQGAGKGPGPGPGAPHGLAGPVCPVLRGYPAAPDPAGPAL